MAAATPDLAIATAAYEDGRYRQVLELLDGEAGRSTAAACVLRARALQALAQFGLAEESCRAGLALAESSGDGRARLEALNRLAFITQEAGKLAEAAACLDRAATIAEPLSTNGIAEDALEAATTRYALGDLRFKQGRFREAADCYRDALGRRQAVATAETIDDARIVNNLGVTTLKLGTRSEAEQLLTRALELRRRLLRPDHPLIAESLHNLAAVQRDRADFDGAERHFLSALAIWEQAGEGAEAALMPVLNDLGTLYQARGRIQEAEQFLRRSLRARERLLGPTHPRTALALNNLGALLRDLGRNEEAEQLYRRVLEIRESALGPDHPDVADSLNNLQAALKSDGALDKREEMLARALAILERTLGSDHPRVATLLNNLGDVQQAQGRIDEAESTFLHALAIKSRTAGREHPDLTAPLNNLAGLYLRAGRLPEAREMFERALRIREQSLGPNSLDTAVSIENLAVVLMRMKDYQGAIDRLRRGLDVRERALGSHSPRLLTDLHLLGELHASLDRIEEAEAFHRRALAIAESPAGSYPAASRAFRDLTDLTLGRKRLPEAQALYRRWLELAEQQTPADFRAMAQCLNGLGAIAVADHDVRAALPLFERALQVGRGELGPLDPSTIAALSGLVRVKLTLGILDGVEALIDQLGEAKTTLSGKQPDVLGRALRAYLERYAQLLLEQGRPDEAKAMRARARRIIDEAA